MLKNKVTKTIALTLASASIMSMGYNSFANEPNILNSKSNIVANELLKGSGNPVKFLAGEKYYIGQVTSATNSNNAAYGYHTTKTDGWGSVGSGRLGAHCNLYRDSDGAIVRTADWKYNTATASTFKNTTSTYSGQKGYYHAQGTSKAYNGTGYETKWCGSSTVTQIKSLNISNEDKQTRINLYTEKNMIKAVGENNIEGYVSLDDLYDNENQPKTPEQAVAFMNKRAKSPEQYRMIPLYDVDGITEIGEYRIDF